MTFNHSRILYSYHSLISTDYDDISMLKLSMRDIKKLNRTNTYLLADKRRSSRSRFNSNLKKINVYYYMYDRDIKYEEYEE